VHFFALKLNIMLVPIMIIILLLILNVPSLNHFEQSKALGLASDKLPKVFDPNMKVEQIFLKPVTNPSGALSQRGNIIIQRESGEEWEARVSHYEE